MKKGICGASCFSKGFPTFAVILLVISILWILSEIKIIVIDIPWIPVVLAVIALGWIIDSCKKK